MISTRHARTARPTRWIAFAAPLIMFLTSVPADALWEVAEGEVFLTAEVAVTSDSNIVGNSSELSDTIYSITPGIGFERSGGRATLNLDVNSIIERYDTYDTQDSESYQANFSLEVPASPSGRLVGSLNAGYFDGYQVDQYLSDRIATRTFNFGLNSTYQITHKINGRLGGTYDKSEPDTSGDYRNSSLSLGLGYNVRPAISTYLDLRFTDSKSGSSAAFGGTENTSTAIIVGVEGEITSKLRGRLGVGYQSADIKTGEITDDDKGPTVDVSLTWQPRTRTTVTVTASNDFRVTSIGETANYANYDINLSQQIGQRLGATLGLSYSTTDFTTGVDRTDEVFDATAGLSYSIGDNYSVGISYIYTDSDSNDPISSFTRSVFRLFANARF